MKVLTNEQFEALEADSNRLQAIVEGKLTIMPTPNGHGWIVERFNDQGLRGVSDRSLRKALDTARREPTNG